MIPRYQTQAMAHVWSDPARLRRWTEVEVAAVGAWHARGQVTDAAWREVSTRAEAPSPERVAAIEVITHHDVVAFVRALTEGLSSDAARHVHRGLTSSDVVDTALAMTMRDAVVVLEGSVGRLQEVLRQRALEHRTTPCAGRTHGVHAEVTSFGLRLAGWYAELRRHRGRLARAREGIAFGKLSGAVGTFSQTDPDFEAHVLGHLGLAAEPIATQVVPRDRHADVFFAIASLGAGLERFAVEIRSLQRTDLREAQEPFAAGQTGSSAMPHKRNPILCERVTGMARLLRGYAHTALENIALWHDRDISHSSVERVIGPDAFHLADTMLGLMHRVISGLRVFPAAMRANIDRSGGLLYSQGVLGVLLEAGMDRTEAYAMVQRAAARVWEGEAKHLRDALAEEPAAAVLDLSAAFDDGHYLRHVDVLLARAGVLP